MIRGLYTAASGMNAEELRQDVIADNLANVSTTGFKKDEAVFQAFPDQMIQRIHDRMDEAASKQASAFGSQAAVPLGKLGQGVMPDATVTNFSDGSVIRTDRPLDLALHGNALFTVQRGDGSMAYTRAGNFTINTDKDLVTEAGELVMSTGGQPINVDGAQVNVSVNGQVLVDGKDAGQLQLAAYDPAHMQKIGGGLYERKEDALEGLGDEPTVDTRVQQGMLEQANVQVVQEMVSMISVMRSYEANSKTIQMQDQSLNTLISEVGRPS
jgi:flagellar basal-body rod protein FlgF